MTAQATMTTLLPCPFCGKSNTLSVMSSEQLGYDIETTGDTISYAVVCDGSQPRGTGGCGASGGFRLSKEDARNLWNRRALPAQPGAGQSAAPHADDTAGLVERLEACATGAERARLPEWAQLMHEAAAKLKGAKP